MSFVQNPAYTAAIRSGLDDNASVSPDPGSAVSEAPTLAPPNNDFVGPRKIATPPEVLHKYVASGWLPPDPSDDDVIGLASHIQQHGGPLSYQEAVRGVLPSDPG